MDHEEILEEILEILEETLEILEVSVALKMLDSGSPLVYSIVYRCMADFISSRTKFTLLSL